MTQGKVAFVSDEDYGYLSKFKWTYSSGYAVRRKPGSNAHILLHRLIMGVDGCPGFEVDHIDRNKLNCTRGNLRFVTRGQNSQNREANSRTGFKGVSPQKGSKTFVAELGHGGKRYRLSGFKTAEDAARAYDSLVLQYFGPHGHVNFPDSAPKTLERLTAEYPQNAQASAVKGISFVSRTGRWKATGPRPDRKHLGFFATEAEAIAALESFNAIH